MKTENIFDFFPAHKVTREQLDFMIQYTENHKQMLEMFLINLKMYRANFDMVNMMFGINRESTTK